MARSIKPKSNSGQPRMLITSALPYVNNVPHLGNIIGCVLSADVFARYCRGKGYETLFICGADEHGTATETKALEEGITPKQICDKYYKIHKEIYAWFNCSFDIFGRTSTPEHVAITQDIFHELHANGYIAEGTLEQTFCVRCNKFLADRYVDGTCPHCSAIARGDQCDACGKLLNPTELLNPKCKICGATPIVKESKHLFFDLPMIEGKLKSWVDAQSRAGKWPQNAVTTTQAWFQEGLKQRCITRDLSWGVPVPLKGYEHKVFYVWFDAPLGYISITKALTDQWEDWWKNPGQVQLYQFMAKDNIPFHTILFPATLLGTHETWTMLHHIASVEYLNYEHGKFSKSGDQGVFGDDAMNSGIPADVWRYYLLVNRPESADTDFSWTDFQEKNNNELLANLGNFVNRTLVFLQKYFGSTVPEAAPGSAEHELVKDVNASIAAVTQGLDAVTLKEPLRKIMHIAKLGNAYFQNNEPWKLITTDPKQCGTVLAVCANLVQLLSVMLEPFLPTTSEDIAKQLNVKKKAWPGAFDLTLESGHNVGKPKPLFRKIEDPEVKKLQDRFKGTTTEVQDPFAQLDLRVAKIAGIQEHPNAEKLYVLQLELGSLGHRQLVAGLRAHYTKDALLGKHILIISNLKPAVLRGMESQGMLLAGQEGDLVRVLQTKAKPGTQVTVEGIPPTPAAQVTIEQFLALGLKVAKGIPTYQGKRLLAGKLPVEIADVMDGVIR